jgi:hypothetical protein
LEIKYCWEGFAGRNNFLYKNFFRFEMDFELKFLGSQGLFWNLGNKIK